MATDVEVQYFSHLNDLVLDNNWGDMIRLLDTCLVKGLPLTEITSASIDAQGDILLTTYAAHKCMLFQIIELTGFTPTDLNGKYRIKGTPSENQLVLKATHVGKSVANKGAAKLASLGYDIIFRDTNDVKRVYRAKNPRSEHPFIRVDESISSDTGSYTSNYAKSAMVGLLENMTHIDDYENPEVLQLPLDTSDLKKNWKITGNDSGVVRGWSKWYWANNMGTNSAASETATQQGGKRNFTLVGDTDAFYILCCARKINEQTKILGGCGLFESSDITNATQPPWFLMSELTDVAANINRALKYNALMIGGGVEKFFVNSRSRTTLLNHKLSTPILVNFQSGAANIATSNNLPTLSVPFYDEDLFLRGSLKHVFHILKDMRSSLNAVTSPHIIHKSMLVTDSSGLSSSAYGYLAFYLGDML